MIPNNDLFKAGLEAVLDDNFQIVIDGIIASSLEVQIQFIKDMILEQVGSPDEFDKILKIKQLVPALASVLGEGVNQFVNALCDTIEGIEGAGTNRLDTLLANSVATNAKNRFDAFEVAGFTGEQSMQLVCAYAGNNPLADMFKKR